MTDLQKIVLAKINRGSQETQGIIDSSTLDSGFKRSAYYDLEKLMDIFLQNKTRHSHWTIITGLRGVGKTTLLAQLYQNLRTDSCDKFYLSLDELHAAGVVMEDIRAVIEHNLKASISNPKKPVFLFLDEVHFLPNWSLAAKILYDKSQRLFLVCTGSSAISFWSNPDIGRRAKMISLPPLSFLEFQAIENFYMNQASPKASKKLDAPSLVSDEEISRSSNLKQVIFEAGSSEKTFIQLREMQADKKKRISDESVNNYIHFYGSMPYAAIIKNSYRYYEEALLNSQPNGSDAENEIRNRIIQTLNTLFLRDLAILGSFDTPTRNKFFNLLLFLANADNINLRKMGQSLELNVLTVQNMLQALTAGEIIIPVAPLGASFGKISKPYKYLFSSPALRLALSHLSLNSDNGLSSADTARLRGILLEDTVAMYLKRLLYRSANHWSIRA